MEENKLQKIVDESGLQPIQAKPLLDSFGDLFVEAHKLVTKSKAIKVTSEDQVEEMKQARKYRILLKNIRNDADKARVSLKEGYLRGANAVQAIFNDIRDVTKPEEDRLLEQEKFIERIREERKEKEINEKLLKLSEYSENDQYSDRKIIENLTDDGFEKYLQTVKSAYEARKKAEQEAENERISQEKEQREEQERIRKENEALRKQAEEREKALAKERAEQQKKLDAERKAREQAEAKIRAERARIEKIEADKRAKELAEKKAEEELARKKLLAPDKEKLLELAHMIDSVTMPSVASREASAVLRATEDMLGKVTNYIREKSKTL
jgi:hypothetical protein